MTMGFIITSLAVMTFVFVFLFKKISKEKYRIVETVTVPNDGFDEVNIQMTLKKKNLY